MSKDKEETQAAAACASGLGTTGSSDLVPPDQPTLSRFTKNEKWFIVGFIAFVGLFRQSFFHVWHRNSSSS